MQTRAGAGRGHGYQPQFHWEVAQAEEGGGGRQKRPPGTGLHCPVRVNSSQWAPPAGPNLSGQKLGGRKILSICSPAFLSAEVPPPGTDKTKSGQALMSHTAGKFLLHTCMLEMTAEITLKTGDTHNLLREVGYSKVFFSTTHVHVHVSPWHNSKRGEEGGYLVGGHRVSVLWDPGLSRGPTQKRTALGGTLVSDRD